MILVVALGWSLVWNYGGHKNDNKAAKTTVNKENDRKLRKQ